MHRQEMGGYVLQGAVMVVGLGGNLRHGSNIDPADSEQVDNGQTNSVLFD
jgi:hypothetical protein